MRLKQITIEGFRSFRQRQVTQLPQAPGLYLMRGVNEVDPSLQGNDVGKSTWADSVYWGLYGVTTRGLRAGNVVSWGGKSAYVEQLWEISGQDVLICRQQNPNGLWLNGKRVDGPDGERAVRDALGLSSVEFLHSVLAGQFTPYFLDLGPTEKLSLFSDVLGLAYWEQRAQIAKERAYVSEGIVSKLSDRLHNVSGGLTALREQKVEAKQDYAVWEQKNKGKRRKTAAKYSTLLRTHSTITAELPATKSKYDKANVVYIEARENVARLGEQIKAIDTQRKDIEKDIAFDRCPFCRKKLGESWRDKLEKELATLDRVSIRTCKEYHKAEAEVSSCTRSLEDKRNTVDGLTKRCSDTSASLRSIENERAALTNNPYDGLLLRLQSDLLAIKKDRRSLSDKHDEASAEQRLWDFWVKGFRDLRLWILDASLAELELRINNSLLQLGLERWTVHLAVERETKTGGVSRGFTVHIRSPGSVDGLPWTGWVGGVSQRLKIASEIGLSKLIADRKGVELGLEIWDEPECHISNQGVSDLLSLLRSRAYEEQKQIWIVSHRVLDFPFDGGLLITKSSVGSEVSVF